VQQQQQARRPIEPAKDQVTSIAGAATQRVGAAMENSATAAGTAASALVETVGGLLEQPAVRGGAVSAAGEK